LFSGVIARYLEPYQPTSILDCAIDAGFDTNVVSGNHSNLAIILAGFALATVILNLELKGDRESTATEAPGVSVCFSGIRP
jgi:hypothetical protein